MSEHESERDSQPASQREHESQSAAAAQATEGLDEASLDVEQLREELRDARDLVLRGRAELENYRKRARRELEEERRYAALPLMREVLPVLDNITRAIEAAESTPEAASLLQGFQMVADQLHSVLANHHCQEIKALGEPFDPHLHEAVGQVPSAEHSPNTVLSVVQRGFELHGRVIRPARVIVSSQPPAAAPSEDSAE